jgi:bifunctional non-homologous end joining protein LigD
MLDGDRWTSLLPAPQELPADLVAEGHASPIARDQAKHEGKRRARARRAHGVDNKADDDSG